MSLWTRYGRDAAVWRARRHGPNAFKHLPYGLAFRSIVATRSSLRHVPAPTLGHPHNFGMASRRRKFARNVPLFVIPRLDPTAFTHLNLQIGIKNSSVHSQLSKGHSESCRTPHFVVARLDRATQYPPCLPVVVQIFNNRIKCLLDHPVEPGDDSVRNNPHASPNVLESERCVNLVGSSRAMTRVECGNRPDLFAALSGIARESPSPARIAEKRESRRVGAGNAGERAVSCR